MAQIAAESTNQEVLTELGRRLRQHRLQQNRTIEEIAQRAGLSVRTVRRAESGENPTLESIVRILRAQDRLEELDAFIPTLIFPVQVARILGKERKRATGSRAAPRDT